MKLNTLEDLFAHELKALYSAENQLVKALPKMAWAAKNANLQAGFAAHLGQTRGHVARLEEIAQALKLAGFVPSVTEAQRVIEQGGVRIDGERLSDKSLKFGSGTTVVVQVGKRKFGKITFK